MTGIAGPMGAGKTLVVTKLLWEEYLRGRQVYANFKLHFPAVHGSPRPRYLTVDDLVSYALEEQDFPSCALGLSELQNWLDSRVSGSLLSRVLTYFANQSAKQDINVYWDSQDWGQVDVRVRRRTRVWIRVTQPYETLHELLIWNQDEPPYPYVAKRYVRGERYHSMFDTRERVPLPDSLKNQIRKKLQGVSPD